MTDTWALKGYYMLLLLINNNPNLWACSATMTFFALHELW